MDTYLRPEGATGTAHCSFKVAHRGGQPCTVCGGTIERVLIQNRGSYFCPACQPIEPRPSRRGAGIDRPPQTARS
ncbi:MAG: zinc finger domain-containing protein [Dehalococcoidia bacterium]